MVSILKVVMQEYNSDLSYSFARSSFLDVMQFTEAFFTDGVTQYKFDKRFILPAFALAFTCIES